MERSEWNGGVCKIHEMSDQGRKIVSEVNGGIKRGGIYENLGTVGRNSRKENYTLHKIRKKT